MATFRVILELDDVDIDLTSTSSHFVTMRAQPVLGKATILSFGSSKTHIMIHHPANFDRSNFTDEQLIEKIRHDLKGAKCVIGQIKEKDGDFRMLDLVMGKSQPDSFDVSFFITVTLLAWMAQKLVSSNNPVK